MALEGLKFAPPDWGVDYPARQISSMGKSKDALKKRRKQQRQLESMLDRPVEVPRLSLEPAKPSTPRTQQQDVGTASDTMPASKKRKRGRGPGEGGAVEHEAADDRKRPSKASKANRSVHASKILSKSTDMEGKKGRAAGAAAPQDGGRREEGTTVLPTGAGSASGKKEKKPEKKQGKYKASGSKQLHSEQLEARRNRGAQGGAGSAAAGASLPPEAALQQQPASLGRQRSGVLDRMKAKLVGGRFRMLNEQLYTSSGIAAFNTMQADPSLFQAYHQGFREQIKSWPKQPVQMAMSFIQRLGKAAVVADFGCGDAAIARGVPNPVHSFDLVAVRPEVTACNMCDVPLDDSSVDVAVFSLALMGTDYGDCLAEACRVLKTGGWLWIAEVRSRFVAGDISDRNEGGAPSLPQNASHKPSRERFEPFLKCLVSLGCQVTEKDVSNKMFVRFVLKKVRTVNGRQLPVEWPPLKACLYKRR